MVYCRHPSNMECLQRLEPCAGKLARTVLRGGWPGNRPSLPDIDKVKNSEGPDKEQFVRILLTKFDPRNKVSNEWVLEQLASFKNLLFKTIIRKNEALNPMPLT